MIVHNAAAVAMVLLALAAAQGRGHDMTGDMTGTMGQGSGAAQTAQPPLIDKHGDEISYDFRNPFARDNRVQHPPFLLRRN